jgi:futalosine hydrolase
MILITAATEYEIKPLDQFLATVDHTEALITGMGPVETAARLSSYLTLHGSRIDAVWNIGVAGAYTHSGVALLDICLAQLEVLGDFGICLQDEILDFDPDLTKTRTPLFFSSYLIDRFKNIFTDHNITFKLVNFVTVNCCTGTILRGEFLRKKYDAGCENMEGAAVAMVCKNFNIPCVELRCVSNMVGDRDKSNWLLSEAIEKTCQAVKILLQANVQDESFPVMSNINRES